MRGLRKRSMAMAVVCAMAITMTGCSGKKADKKEKPESTATEMASASPQSEEGLEGIKASGKGNKKSDVPLVVGISSFDKEFNPFQVQSENDDKAVGLTQLKLLTVDREGALVNKAMEGEVRRYNGEDYTYQGPANIKVVYDEKAKETVYHIRIRNDILFSDGEPVTIDDVIFSMYAFADSSYQGKETFGKLPVKGMKEYQGSGQDGKVKNIAGIERIDDYRLKITTNGYSKDFIESLNIPICPLHFYGNENQYNYKKNQFGFSRGDISSLIKKKNSPTGAGAYKFIKYESGVIYYEANEKYYRDCPLTAFIQLKEIGKKDTEHRVEILREGDVDIVDLEGSNEAITQITTTNSNGKLNGGTISTRLYDGERYAYIGMNARNVCVDEKKDSTRSKNLRKGLATLLGTNRYEMVELCTQSSKVINYPSSDTSWSVPQSEDEEYRGAFVTDKDGNIIYSSNMTVEERSEAACKAALGFLKLAGYKVKKGKIVAAPEGGSTEFTVLVPDDTDSGEGLYTLMSNVKPMFQKIGLKLVIVDGMKQRQIEKILRKGKQQIWCGFAETKVNGNLNAMYHSNYKKDPEAGRENYFRIVDSDLDEYIEETMTTVGLKKSIRLYGQCYDKIMEWAVEVPVYQERDITIFSSSRINMETIVPDITAYYGWMDELQSIEMK